jgi:hypothetical protein
LKGGNYPAFQSIFFKLQGLCQPISAARCKKKMRQALPGAPVTSKR